jgi:low temperature requirement protein LtrA
VPRVHQSILRSLHVAPSREGDRVTTLELFFDLVFAFAFTQVTALMAHGQPPGSILDGLIVLSLLWWSWCSFSWLANQAHADEGIVRGAFILATVAIFIACIAIPDAFHQVAGSLSGAAVLVACYAVVRFAHLGVYLVAAGHDTTLRRQISVTLVAALIPTISLLTIGAVAGGTMQRWIWLMAVCYDFAAVFVSAKGTQGWRIQSAPHFAERYGLIVLLAIGESIVAIAAGLGHTHITWRVLVGAALSILIAVGLYFAYFVRLVDQLEEALEKAEGRTRARLAEDAFTYFHFPIIAGIIVSALGIDLSMAHLGARNLGLTGGWALGGGVALFLAGTVAAGVRGGHPWPVSRVVAIVVLLALAPVLSTVRSLVAVGVTAAAILALALAEASFGGRSESSTPTGPGPSGRQTRSDRLDAGP